MFHPWTLKATASSRHRVRRNGFSSDLTKVRRAFTLIEILVVIAIVAVLAAILFPVFAQTREKGRQTACLSNMKQIALGVMQYTQDYDHRLPVYGANNQCRGRWQWQIFSYVKNPQVFTCPDLADSPWNPNQLDNMSRYGCSSQPLLGDSALGGYGWNLALGYDTTAGSSAAVPGLSLESIKKPAETIIIGDTGFPGTGSTSQGWTMCASDPRNTALSKAFPQPGLYAQFRHTTQATIEAAGNQKLPVAGRSNFIFLDGHAKNLDIVTAFQKATTEDGSALKAETRPDQVVPNSQYILWNID